MIWLTSLFAQGTSCPGPSLFDVFPSWYVYLPKTTDVQGQCVPQIQHLTDVWLIVAAVIEILLRLASLAAVVFVIYGGVMYTVSEGSPDKTSQAKNTIVSALVGLALSVSAALIVSFIAQRFIPS